MIRIAPEGFSFIISSFLVALIFGTITYWVWKSGFSDSLFYAVLFATGLSLVLTLFMVFFFRDPERKVPDGQGLFVSPADGKVILIKDIYEEDFLKSDAREISIFMSPLDVHVNRSPCEGKVSAVKYSPGKFMAAYKDESSLENEHIEMVLEGNQGRVLVRQVAGFVARRAVCRVGVGDTLRRGERYGIIKFSSRLDVYLPKTAEIKVKVGDRVKAGESVIAANSAQ